MFEEVFELEVDKILQERDAMLRAKDEALRSKDEALRSKDEALRSKDEALRSKDTQVEILRLLVKGKSPQQIAKELSIDIQEIEALRK